MPDDKIDVENVNTPGRTERVNRAKYEAMRSALLRVLPIDPPGLKVAEAKAALLPHLDQGLFPGGDKAGWWLKAVQLDLEAKGVIARAKGSPVRLCRVAECRAGSARPPRALGAGSVAMHACPRPRVCHKPARRLDRKHDSFPVRCERADLLANRACNRRVPGQGKQALHRNRHGRRGSCDRAPD